MKIEEQKNHWDYYYANDRHISNFAKSSKCQ